MQDLKKLSDYIYEIEDQSKKRRDLIDDRELKINAMLLSMLKSLKLMNMISAAGLIADPPCPQAIFDAVVASVIAFRGSAPQRDDITLMLIKVAS